MQQQKKRQFTCAIFGLGRAGRIHLGNVQSRRDIRIKYVVDAAPQAASELLDDAEKIQVLTPDEEDRVFEDKEVDFCVVASPTFTHESIVRKCIAGGKQIFCEKPIARSIDDMIDCYRRAEQAGLVLHCSFNRRYDPSFATLKAKIPTAVGDVYNLRTCSRDSPVPPMEYLRTSGGIFHDCGVHDFHVTHWMLDDWPQTVYATGSTHEPRMQEFGDHDNATVVMTFAGGRIATVDLSRYSTYGYDQRVEVHGRLGMLASNNVTDRAVTAFGSDGVTNANIQFSFQQRYAEAYVLSLDHFVRKISGDSSAFTVTGCECVNVSRIADACEESIKTGQIVKFDPIRSI